MSFEELVKAPKATKFFLAILSLVLGGVYLMLGPQRAEVGVIKIVVDFMKATTLTYIIGEAGLNGAKAIGDSFGKK